MALNLTNEEYKKLRKIAFAAAKAAGTKNQDAIDEIIDESIFRYIKMVDTYDDSKGKKENYLYTIAQNLAITKHNRQGKIKEYDDIERLNDKSYNIEIQLDAKEKIRVCDCAASKVLDRREQNVYKLMKKQYNAQEISEELGISINSVYSATSHLREKLNRVLEMVA